MKKCDQLILGIDGGGTRTLAVLLSEKGQTLAIKEFGCGNFQLLHKGQLSALLAEICASFPKVKSVGIGMAGLRNEHEKCIVKEVIFGIWQDVRCYVSDDLEPILECVPAPNEAKCARVVLISGTGSSCLGRNVEGKEVRIGGWGGRFGDEGGAYGIAIEALRQMTFAYDHSGKAPQLLGRLLRLLSLEKVRDLSAWAARATKSEIAGMATLIFEAWKGGDAFGRSIIERSARRLMNDASACAKRLGEVKGLQFILSGGCFQKQDGFAKLVRDGLLQTFQNELKTEVIVSKKLGAEGAGCLGKRKGKSQVETFMKDQIQKDQIANLEKSQIEDHEDHEIHKVQNDHYEIEDHEIHKVQNDQNEIQTFQTFEDQTLQTLQTFEDQTFENCFEKGKSVIPKSTAISATEERLWESRNLDQLSTRKGIELMLQQEGKVASSILSETSKLIRAIGWIVRGFRQGGRLIYVGAGTSGRLGVLDASECPPTFQTDPKRVVGVIAGGRNALWKSIEGAEDDEKEGRKSMRHLGLKGMDVVVGISASGRTPFVWGALSSARWAGAKTVMICFNPHLKFHKGHKPDVVICPKIGAEVLTGSTRLKAGTATKMILNLMSTLSMVRLGKVKQNLMISLSPSNEKLRERAIRILVELVKCSRSEARATLEETSWDIKKAAQQLRKRDR